MESALSDFFPPGYAHAPDALRLENDALRALLKRRELHSQETKNALDYANGQVNSLFSSHQSAMAKIGNLESQIAKASAVAEAQRGILDDRNAEIAALRRKVRRLSRSQPHTILNPALARLPINAQLKGDAIPVHLL